MQITKNQINYLLLSLVVPGYFNLLNPGKIVVITVLSYILVLFFCFKLIFQKKIVNESVFKIFLFYGLIITIRGLLSAESKSDYGSLILEILPVTLIIPFFYILGKNIFLSIYIIEKIMKYSFVLVLIPLIAYLIDNESDTAILIRTISPFYFFILILPNVKRISRFKIILLTFISIFLAIDHRSNIINISISVLVLFIVYKIPQIIKYIGKKIWILFTIIPVFILYLSFNNGTFDFSNDVITDSRSTIYNDVFSAVSKENAYILGLGPKKIETDLKYSDHFNTNSIYNSGRNASESLMLNYFHWGGILMMLLFSFIVLKGVYLSLFDSKNRISIMIAFVVLFRFLYSFVEFRLGYDLSSFFYFFLVGLAYNQHLRSMNNLQVRKIFKL